ncbi:HAD family phosphatase [Pedobacter sp. Leaf176]|uniref:HAD family hydrolase n=1 Tax=Pedobacter sp. Leaf176 TaxID=1736286 RepID=UPI0006F95A7D|nr:HAD family phosphatase [Pedobacter sp. Leaf176]KQR71023.1 haloacid dehalogenase [Pedobacter sp. Leaf176]
MHFKPKALLFDLNGTMIDDMDYHNKAWYQILNDDLNANISYEEVKKQMYGKNDELLKRVFGDDYFTQEQLDEISIKKEKIYQLGYAQDLSLIAGLGQFLINAEKSGMLMAIGSAAIPFNIDFVLDGLNIRSYFKAIVSANDVETSKPNPETFLKGAEALGVQPEDCLVLEDAPKGVEAALRANMKCIVLSTAHNAEEFLNYPNVLKVVSDYTDPIFTDLID